MKLMTTDLDPIIARHQQDNKMVLELKELLDIYYLSLGDFECWNQEAAQQKMLVTEYLSNEESYGIQEES